MAIYDITTAGAVFNFITQTAQFNTSFLIDDTHFIGVFNNSSTGFNAQVFTINTSTWAITASGSLADLGNTSAYINIVKIDTNNFQVSRNQDDDGQTEIIRVNTTTWAITTASSLLNFNTTAFLDGALVSIDSNHTIVFYTGVDDDGFAQTFEINTTTYAITTKTSGTGLEFDTQDNRNNSAVKIDTNHIVNFWRGGATGLGYTQVFTINTTTWAVTTSANSLNFDTAAMAFSVHDSYIIDSTHILDVWGDSTTNLYAQVFTVNTTTWAISTSGAKFTVSTQQPGEANISLSPIDTNHFILFYPGSGSDGFTTTLRINTTTWAVSTVANLLEFDTTQGLDNSSLKIDTSHFVNIWRGTSNYGYTQVFTVEGAPLGPANLKSYNTNLKANIKSINTNAIANIKSLNTNI